MAKKTTVPPRGICRNDHLKGHSYLLSTTVESIAPSIILTRVLENYVEMELSDDQIRSLLDIAKKYHEENMRVCAEFTNVTAELESPDSKRNVKETKRLLDEHARLFKEHESLVLDADENVQKILSEKQMRKSLDLYERQRRTMLNRLKSGLKKAVAPTLKLS